MHDDKGLGTSLFEGHRGDGPAFAPSPPSSLVQTRRERGVTSMYLPKNSIGCPEAVWPSTKRYVPPVRTCASQEMKDTPNDFGVHHRLSSSGLVHASLGPLHD